METRKGFQPPILRLPVEILQNIFRGVVDEREWSSIRPVRLTCRHWRDLVAADHALPRHIVLRTGNDCNVYHYPSIYQFDHCVHTATQLARALECIQDAQFRFQVIFEYLLPEGNWELVPWHRFGTQCTSLSIFAIAYDHHQAASDILRHIPLLYNLRRLVLSGNSIVFPSSLPSALQPIPVHNTNGQYLDLFWSPGSLNSPLGFELNPFQHIFNRVTVFTLCTYWTVSPSFLVTLLSSLWVLEDLTWHSSNQSLFDFDLIQKSVDWRFKLKELQVDSKLLPVFLPSVLNELVSLTMRFRPFVDESGGKVFVGEEYDPIYLPRLEELTEEGSWLGLIRTEAPKLQRLRLRGYDGKPEYLVQTKLDPTVLEIDDDESGKAIQALFSRAPFPKLTELRMCVAYDWALEDDRLVRLLSSDDGRRLSSLFPRLRTLVVDVSKWRRPRTIFDDVAKTEMATATRELSRALSASGLPYTVAVR
ncbi:hypothetical protein FRC20_001383 [Serendipita sp. 405]|nr:hypothetical protein FRC20_001383 [Serendipita sp. 405]